MPNRSLLIFAIWIVFVPCAWAIQSEKPAIDEPLLEIKQWIEGTADWQAALSQSDTLPEVLHRGLDADQAQAVQQFLWEAWRARSQEALNKAIADKVIGDGRLTMKWLERRFGESTEPMPLFISMHGGGGAPESVNDQQWRNQIRLYEPEVGIVVAPRAPTNTWNLWHEGHIDGLFDRLIEAYVVTQNVDPNRIYLMGYSAGGDGVFQLAPRMADRFAAASMMAGHPNESRPLGLRNLPFAIFMGGKDSAYNRNQVAADWGKQLDALQEKDPTGYVHLVKIYPEKGHWMDREDREALPWMLQYRRQTSPKHVVWLQDDVLHRSFYWLSVPPESQPQAGQLIQAEVKGNTIAIQSEVEYEIELGLHDALVDLSQPITVQWNGNTVYQGPVKRTSFSLIRNFDASHDTYRTWSCCLKVARPKSP